MGVFIRGSVSALSTLALAAGMAAATSTTAQATPTPLEVRVNVLVLDDGQPMVGAIRARLQSEGVPTTVIDLNSAQRQQVSAAFLGATTAAPLARFSGVVLPSEAPAQLSGLELGELAASERRTQVREVNAYTWAHPAVGLQYADYSGSVDGMSATLTPAALSGAFSYLRGTVRFDDLDKNVTESWGYLARPRTDMVTGESFTPLL